MKKKKELVNHFMFWEKIPTQQKRPRKLRNRILPQPSTIHFEGRSITNPYELKKMGYEPSKSCWDAYHKSKMSKVDVKTKPSNDKLKMSA